MEKLVLRPSAAGCFSTAEGTAPSTVRGARSDSSRRPQEAPSLEKRVYREALLAREDDVRY